MGKETITQIYHNIKKECNRPSALLTYVTYDGKTYNCGNVIAIEFNNDEKSIKEMTEVSEKKNFYAFFHSEKGMEFFNKNIKGITQALTNEILLNAGYGETICKN